MGHSQNSRESANQSKEGALDTDQDKGVEETKETEETMEANEEEETMEHKEGVEEQPTAEQSAEEKLIEEEAAPKEEVVAEAQKEEAVTVEAEEEAGTVIPEEAEEVEKKEKPKVPEKEIVEERIYTIPLRRAWISPRKKRAPRAVRLVKSFVQRHMKVETRAKGDEEEEKGRLVISNEVNEKLWGRGIEKPPRNIRVRAVKDKEGTVTLYLAEGD